MPVPSVSSQHVQQPTNSVRLSWTTASALASSTNDLCGSQLPSGALPLHLIVMCVLCSDPCCSPPLLRFFVSHIVTPHVNAAEYLVETPSSAVPGMSQGETGLVVLGRITRGVVSPPASHRSTHSPLVFPVITAPRQPLPVLCMELVFVIQRCLGRTFLGQCLHLGFQQEEPGFPEFWKFAVLLAQHLHE